MKHYLYIRMLVFEALIMQYYNKNRTNEPFFNFAEMILNAIYINVLFSL